MFYIRCYVALSKMYINLIEYLKRPIRLYNLKVKGQKLNLTARNNLKEYKRADMNNNNATITYWAMIT